MAQKPTYEELEQKVKELEKESLERQRAEKALEEKENFLKIVFDAIQDGISVRNRDLTITLVNRWMEKKYASQMPLVGEKCYTAFQKRNSPCPWCPAILAMDSGKMFSEIVPYPSEDDPTGWLELTAFPIRDASGEVTGCIEHVKNITERRQAERALQDRERQYRLLADNVQDVIWTRDMDLRLTYISPSITEQQGYTVEEAMARTLEEIWPPDSLQLVEEILAEELEIEKQDVKDLSRSRTLEVEVKCKDGSTIWTEAKMSFLRDQNGHPKGIIGVTRDISERKRSEEVVKLNEQRLEALLELNQMAEATLEEIAAFAMEEAVRLTQSQIGYVAFASEDESILTMHAWSRQALRECKTTDKPITYLVENTGLWGEAVRQRRPIITNDYQAPNPLKKGMPEGHVRVMRHMNIPIFDGDRIVIVAGVGNKETAYDDSDIRQLSLLMSGMWRIVQRKRMEEALRESEEKYRTVLEANPDPVVVYDNDGRVIYFNPAFTHVFGWTLKERLGKKMDLYVPEDAWRENKMMIEKVLAGERFSGIETSRYTKKGKIISVSISGSIYRDQKGHPFGSVINLRDISEQKKLEARLQQVQKMEAIGTLAGGIAHDFNNVLYSIIGYTELTMNDVPEGSLARKNLKEVFKGAMRAKDMVQQILAFSRKAETEKKPIKVQSVAKEALKLLRTSIPATMEIRYNIDADCRPVLADPTQVHQVVMNLATNAYQAMREKGGLLELNLVEEALGADDSDLDLDPGTYLKLSVSDTGHGMDNGVMQKIFDPYFTTRGPGEGTGMGLAVVHGIVKSHGGDIKVSSELGGGTVFHVYLPLIETRPFEPKTISAEPAPTGTERILFVDDEEYIVLMMQQILERLGYQVKFCTSSVEALEAFKAKPDEFDLVITDMTMPNMTGVELAPKLLEVRPDIPIIICTGFSEMVDENRAKAIGIREYVMKPIVIEEIAKTIRKVLDEGPEK